MGSSCCKPRAEDGLSGSQPRAASTSLSVSNHGGYATHSDPSTTPVRAGPIISYRASELGRAAGYALPPYVSSSTPPTTRQRKTNELARSAGYAHAGGPSTATA